MTVAQAFDVAYVRLRSPDLEIMRQFYLDFGLIEVAAGEDRLYMRGHGSAPFAVVCELNERPGFAALGIRVADDVDLAAVAQTTGSAVETSNAPGGGSLVRLRDPSGHKIELVQGQTGLEPIPVPASVPWNQDQSYPRLGITRRVPEGTSHVLRLGHVMLGATNYAESLTWYRDVLGLVISDEVQAGPGIAIGAFLRADRADQPCDHHTIALVERGPDAGLMHYAFEVANLDDLMVGSAYLEAKGHKHFWGVGRHILGSQVFDYWFDPLGHEIEHWTDGDQFVAADGGGVASVDQLIGVQWGQAMPAPPQL